MQTFRDRAFVLSLVIGLLSANGIAVAQVKPDLRITDISPGDIVNATALFQSDPVLLTVAALPPGIDKAGISDVETADFNGDGRGDVAVAWYITDSEGIYPNQRTLTIYFGCGATDFVRGVDIDLYIPCVWLDALSVFRNGTADIGVGDFDGDDDPDLAVPAFFGDEIWFIENLGGGDFEPYLKYPFGYNSTGSNQTPPEVSAADFDGDGRDELVCISDPHYYVQNHIIHFWKTSGSVADMQRVYWEGIGGVATKWTRGLAIADFDGDERPDLCFSGSMDDYETEPVLTFWYDLDTQANRFSVHTEFPGFACSDVLAVQPDAGCPPGVILTDLEGTAIEYWAHDCAGTLSFTCVASESGYAGSPNRGMTAVAADIDDDGDLDVVTKQKLGLETDADQIELTRSSDAGAAWTRVEPTPINTIGFWDDPTDEILRPRNLASYDLFGNTRPEIVAGFGRFYDVTVGGQPIPSSGSLRFAVWANGCVGDANVSGAVTKADLRLIGLLSGRCEGDPYFNPNADLNKDGCIDGLDYQICQGDLGCTCPTD